MENQTKTRATISECFKGYKNALKEFGKKLFIDNDETNITNVEEIPGLETYTSEEDIKMIKKMNSYREKIKNIGSNLDKQSNDQNSRPRNMKYRIAQSKQKEQKMQIELEGK